MPHKCTVGRDGRKYYFDARMGHFVTPSQADASLNCRSWRDAAAPPDPHACRALDAAACRSRKDCQIHHRHSKIFCRRLPGARRWHAPATKPCDEGHEAELAQLRHQVALLRSHLSQRSPATSTAAEAAACQARAERLQSDLATALARLRDERERVSAAEAEVRRERDAAVAERNECAARSSAAAEAAEAAQQALRDMRLRASVAARDVALARERLEALNEQRRAAADAAAALRAEVEVLKAQAQQTDSANADEAAALRAQLEALARQTDDVRADAAAVLRAKVEALARQTDDVRAEAAAALRAEVEALEAQARQRDAANAEEAAALRVLAQAATEALQAALKENVALRAAVAEAKAAGVACGTAGAALANAVNALGVVAHIAGDDDVAAAAEEAEIAYDRALHDNDVGEARAALARAANELVEAMTSSGTNASPSVAQRVRQALADTARAKAAEAEAATRAAAAEQALAEALRNAAREASRAGLALTQVRAAKLRDSDVAQATAALQQEVARLEHEALFTQGEAARHAEASAAAEARLAQRDMQQEALAQELDEALRQAEQMQAARARTAMAVMAAARQAAEATAGAAGLVPGGVDLDRELHNDPGEDANVEEQLAAAIMLLEAVAATQARVAAAWREAYQIANNAARKAQAQADASEAVASEAVQEAQAKAQAAAEEADAARAAAEAAQAAQVDAEARLAEAKAAAVSLQEEAKAAAGTVENLEGHRAAVAAVQQSLSELAEAMKRAIPEEGKTTEGAHTNLDKAFKGWSEAVLKQVEAHTAPDEVLRKRVTRSRDGTAAAADPVVEMQEDVANRAARVAKQSNKLFQRATMAEEKLTELKRRQKELSGVQDELQSALEKSEAEAAAYRAKFEECEARAKSTAGASATLEKELKEALEAARAEAERAQAQQEAAEACEERAAALAQQAELLEAAEAARNEALQRAQTCEAAAEEAAEAARNEALQRAQTCEAAAEEAAEDARAGERHAQALSAAYTELKKKHTQLQARVADMMSRTNTDEAAVLEMDKALNSARQERHEVMAKLESTIAQLQALEQQNADQRAEIRDLKLQRRSEAKAEAVLPDWRLQAAKTAAERKREQDEADAARRAKSEAANEAQRAAVAKADAARLEEQELALKSIGDEVANRGVVFFARMRDWLPQDPVSTLGQAQMAADPRVRAMADRVLKGGNFAAAFANEFGKLESTLGLNQDEVQQAEADPAHRPAALTRAAIVQDDKACMALGAVLDDDAAGRASAATNYKNPSAPLDWHSHEEAVDAGTLRSIRFTNVQFDRYAGSTQELRNEQMVNKLAPVLNVYFTRDDARAQNVMYVAYGASGAGKTYTTELVMEKVMQRITEAGQEADYELYLFSDYLNGLYDYFSDAAWTKASSLQLGGNVFHGNRDPKETDFWEGNPRFWVTDPLGKNEMQPNELILDRMKGRSLTDIQRLQKDRGAKSMWDLLEKGFTSRFRRIGNTGLNATSSRSHMFFVLRNVRRLAALRAGDEKQARLASSRSFLTLVDMAGTEDLSFLVTRDARRKAPNGEWWFARTGAENTGEQPGLGNFEIIKQLQRASYFSRVAAVGETPSADALGKELETLESRAQVRLRELAQLQRESHHTMQSLAAFREYLGDLRKASEAQTAVVVNYNKDIDVITPTEVYMNLGKSFWSNHEGKTERAACATVQYVLGPLLGTVPKVFVLAAFAPRRVDDLNTYRTAAFVSDVACQGGAS